MIKNYRVDILSTLVTGLSTVKMTDLSYIEASNFITSLPDPDDVSVVGHWGMTVLKGSKFVRDVADGRDMVRAYRTPQDEAMAHFAR